MAYKSQNIVKGATSISVAASQTNSVVSESFRINDPKTLAVDFYVSAVTDGGSDSSVIVKVQSSSGGDNWVDSKAAAAVTSTGWKSITLMAETAGDQSYLPLRPLVRVVVTTAAGDAITIRDIIVSN